MKRASIILLSAFISVTVLAQEKVIDQVVAVVGGNIILESDIEEQYLQAIAQGFDYDGDLKCEIFEDLLYQKLLLNQAVIDSIEVTETEVEQRLDGRLGMMISQIGSEQALEEYFSRTIVEIKQDLREMLEEQLLTQKMQSEITQSIKITPSEVRRFFKDIHKDSIPLVNSEVEMAQIVVKPKITDDEIKKVKDKLNSFLARIEKGDKFSTLAVLYSEDPGSAKNGGELGYISRTDLVPEFAAVAFNLTEPNEVSSIVTTEFGYHIIQLMDRKGERINVRHILLSPKISFEEKQRTTNLLDSLVKEIRSGNISFEDAAKKYSDDEDTNEGGGLIMNPRTGTSKFEADEIDRFLYFAIKDLNINEVSNAVESKDERNKTIYKLIKLKNRTEAHQANMKQDYQFIQEIALSKKQQDEINNWISNKQKQTYVKINGSYKKCSFKYEGWLK